MEEVNDEIFMKAVENFKQDPDDREIFVNMSFARRMMNVEPNYYSNSSSSDGEEVDDMFFLLMFVQSKNNYIPKEHQRISMLTSDAFKKEILNGNPRTCYELFGMDRPTFTSLCNYLRTHKFLTNSHWITVEEAVGMFLLIVGHNVRIRVIADHFQHSTKIVDRQFKEIVRAICHLGKFIIRPSQSNEVHPRIANNTKFFPYFKKCIGAIDRSYISAWALASKLVSYSNRKATITHNIMCACDFDMKFTFVYTGWEGTANDSRVFLDALQRWPLFSGFWLSMHLGVSTSYHIERYHLRDFRGWDRPEGAKELFSYRHSSLCNVIERCFGILKAQFPVLKMMPRYKPCRQGNVMRACCTIHNFIRMTTRNDRLFTQFNIDNLTVEGEGGDNSDESSHTVDLID
ncbi:protein ALP1-like [Quercus robur]|uniref:protein ALP1-like n=1 Tax=Quercus robur TaxID=38942 RepID=UPI0021631B14|nr:protein ALP1-like [Quercus robur]